jgi:hypothetical protein
MVRGDTVAQWKRAPCPVTADTPAVFLLGADG